MGPDAGADRQEISPRRDQGRGVIDSDPADGDRWNLHDFLPDGQDFGLGPMCRLLGVGRVEGAEGDVVRPLLRRLHAEVATVVAGRPDHRRLAHDAPGRGHRGIRLAHMHAVASQGRGQIGAVVQDHRHAAPLGDRRQTRHRRRDGDVVGGLEPYLQGRDRPGVQRTFELRREGLEVVYDRRGDQIELANVLRHVPQVRRRRPCVNRARCERVAIAHSPAIANQSHLAFGASLLCTCVTVTV